MQHLWICGESESNFEQQNIALKGKKKASNAPTLTKV
jgi:hypothetical protein